MPASSKNISITINIVVVIIVIVIIIIIIVLFRNGMWGTSFVTETTRWQTRTPPTSDRQPDVLTSRTMRLLGLRRALRGQNLGRVLHYSNSSLFRKVPPQLLQLLYRKSTSSHNRARNKSAINKFLIENTLVFTDER